MPLVPTPKPGPTRRLTVEKAVELMRSLPFDGGANSDLVLRVMRKTLQSSGVSVPEIVDAAAERERELSRSLDAGRAAIEQLAAEITTRQESLAVVERELSETRGMREQLEDAIENETQIGIPVVRDEPAQDQAPIAR